MAKRQKRRTIPQGRATTSQGWDAEFGSVKSDLTVNATWKEKPKTYSTGTYKVGKDIPAGEYCITSTSSTTSAYYCVYPDASKSDILNNDNFTGRGIRHRLRGTAPRDIASLLHLSRRCSAKRRHRQGTWHVQGGLRHPLQARTNSPPRARARDTTRYTTARIPKRASCKTTTSRGRTTFKSPTASIFCSVGAQARLSNVPAIPRERISLHPGSKAPSPKPERQGFKPARKKVVQRWHDLRSSLDEDSARAKRGSGLAAHVLGRHHGDARSRDVLGKHVARVNGQAHRERGNGASNVSHAALLNQSDRLRRDGLERTGNADARRHRAHGMHGLPRRHSATRARTDCPRRRPPRHQRPILQRRRAASNRADT